MSYIHDGCNGCKYTSTSAVDSPCREYKNTHALGSAKYKSMPNMYVPMPLQGKSDAVEAYCDTRDGCTKPDMCPMWRGDGKSACYDSEAEKLPENKQKEIAEAYEMLLNLKATPPTHDDVNHPKHYCRDNAMECIDEMVLVFGKKVVADFCLCNAWKYRYRAADKNGAQDMEKSDWYMRKYRDLKEGLSWVGIK